MKTRNTGKLFGVLLVAGLMAGAPAWAEIEIEIGGGMTVPTGDLNQYYGKGLAVSGGFFTSMTPFWRGGLVIGYHGFSLDSGHLLADVSGLKAVDGGAVKVLSICGEIRAQSGGMDMATYFGGVGVGMFNVSTSDLTLTYDPPDTSITESYDGEMRFGGYVDAGFGVPVSPKVRIGAKVQYNVFAIGEQRGDVFADLSTTRSYFTGQAVVIFSP